MQKDVVLCSRAAEELSNSCPTTRADKNSALDFTSNKVNDNPLTLKRGKDIALHHQYELCLGLLSQKHMERYSSPACASEGPLSQKETVERSGGGFFHVQSICICSLWCKTGAVVSLPSGLPVVLCTQGHAALP